MWDVNLHDVARFPDGSSNSCHSSSSDADTDKGEVLCSKPNLSLASADIYCLITDLNKDVLRRRRS